MKSPFIHIFIIIAFLANSFGPMPAIAQAQDFHLPAPGVMVPLSPDFNPPILKGIKIRPDNPFNFEFILDRGDNDSFDECRGGPCVRPQDGPTKGRPLQQESLKLIKYFLASLTIPEQDLWVNLSPYEKNRVIPQSFGLTEMGRDLLAEDYMLKQITASLIYPEDATGKKFWKHVYAEAFKRYGTTNIPVNTFNKVWIVPEKAVVYENQKSSTAYVVESKLKVMLEQDYLSMEKHECRGGPCVRPQENSLGSQVIRQIVIPTLTREVNEAKNFAHLRQVYNSLILATWYKKKIKDSILAQVYVDKNKVKGAEYNSTVIPANPSRGTGAGIRNDVELIYQQYLKAFKKGVYNYIKEEVDPITQEPTPRKYFSGGVNFAMSSGHTDMAMGVFKIITGAIGNAFGGKTAQNADIVTVSLAPPADELTDEQKEALKRLKRSPHASTWSDGHGFTGVSLEHYVTAQGKLPAGNDKTKYREFIRQGYTASFLDGLNTAGYEDPRLGVTIIDQNGNPKKQSILEAISNCIDALGGDIGQFGKGVKQIIDWLKANGQDRVDIYTRQANAPAYQLTIKRAPNGQEYIQIKEISPEEFTSLAGEGIKHGTVVSLALEDSIPDQMLNDLGSTIHERFAFVKNINIITQQGAREDYVNGWETREFIVPFHRPVPSKKDKQGKNIRAQFSPNRVTIIDNGRGMDAVKISRMFVPASGDKQPSGLKDEKDIRKELDHKLVLVHDTKGAFIKTTPKLIFALAKLNGGKDKAMSSVLTAAPAMGVEEIRQEIIHQISLFENEAYRQARKEAVRQNPDFDWEPLRNFHTDGACEFTSEEFRKGLQKAFAQNWQGMEVRQIRYDRPPERWADHIASFHYFLIVSYKNHLWVVDPSWQQFLSPKYDWGIRAVPKYLNSYPRVLVVELKNLEASINKTIPEEARHVWRLGIEQNQELIDDLQKEKSDETGGIDFTSGLLNVRGDIKFHLDPALLEQLRNTTGFVPVIINIQPLKNLQKFLND